MLGKIELRNCPHCGGNQIEITSFFPHQVCCRGCGARGGLGHTGRNRDEAIAAWNRRTPEKGTSVVRWTKIDLEDVSTYPAWHSDVLLSYEDKVMPVFFTVKQEEYCWVRTDNVPLPFDDGDFWAYLPEPPEGI